MRKILIGLGLSVISLPLLLVIWYLAVVWWAPMDALTMAMPRSVRSFVSHEISFRAHFDATGFPMARRALKLDPSSEEARMMFCATGVFHAENRNEALGACSRLATTTNNTFCAQVVAQAYEDAHRPCEGLPILKRTMGEEKVNNISPIFSVGRLEVTCGLMDDAEKHLRTVVRLREEDLRSNHWEDRPPEPYGPTDTYEKAFRLYLSEARQNLSSLLTLRHKDAEALSVCRSALGLDLKSCSCQFKPRGAVHCDSSAP